MQQDNRLMLFSGSSSSREAEQLRLLVENARDYAMFLLEQDGTILSWNPGVQNLLGYEEREWLGQNCEIIFAPEDRARGEHLLERDTAVAEGRAEDERWHVKKDGTRFYASGVMSAVYDEAGNLVSLGKVLRDYTEKKQMEEALQAANREMEARVEARTRVLQQRTVELERARTERQSLMERLVTAQEEERRRISRELHDSTGQHLTAIALELAGLETVAARTRVAVSEAAAFAAEAAEAAAEAAQRAAELATTARKLTAVPAQESAALYAAAAAAHATAQEAAQTARTATLAATDAANAASMAAGAVASINEAGPRLTQLRSVLNEMSQEVHRIAVNLRPTSLDDLGLAHALQAYVEEWGERAAAAVAFEASGLEASGLEARRRLPPLVETTVYRIVQEALTNVAKHACPRAVEPPAKAAALVSVTLQRRAKDVLVVVEDDGPGFDLEKAARHDRLGLVGMRERAELMGGTLEVESQPGQGTTVFLRIPVS